MDGDFVQTIKIRTIRGLKKYNPILLSNNLCKIRNAVGLLLYSIKIEYNLLNLISLHDSLENHKYFPLNCSEKAQGFYGEFSHCFYLNSMSYPLFIYRLVKFYLIFKSLP